MLKVKVGYPDKAQEKEIMRRMAARERPKIQPVTQPSELLKARTLADAVYLDSKVEDYIVDIVFASREPKVHKLAHLEKLIAYGASPRATIALARASKVHAFMAGRAFVTPQDVKDHRSRYLATSHSCFLRSRGARHDFG